MDRKIFFGGDIITMDESMKTAEAVITEDGMIAEVGDFDSIKRSVTPDTKMVDLNGAAMMPAFIDSHGHFSGYANTLLNASLENCKSFDDIENTIKQFISGRNIKKGEWVTALGYDNEMLKEHTQPTLDLLDRAAPENPVIAVHISNHSGVFNSAALEKLGVPQTKSGFMEETEFIKYFGMIPAPNMEKLMDAYTHIQDIYASYGITTVQEGMFQTQLIPMYKELLKLGILKLDVVGYIDIVNAEKIKSEFQEHIKKYSRNFKIGGYKIFLDGSPQSKTAWVREPYTDGSYGYGTLSDEKLYKYIQKSIDDKMQLLAHCNGDMAADQLINAFENTSGEYYNTRPVMIHAQILGQDQLDKMKELHITPSFFVDHVYRWGDAHIKNLGRRRAEKISPAGSALKRGMVFTFHQDAPVIKPDMLETIRCAVMRRTQAGELLGADERIPVYEALKAVTINAAWQYHEEDRKGSIECGKNADFVILDRNPLKISPNEIGDIKILRTIKNGKVIFMIRA